MTVLEVKPHKVYIRDLVPYRTAVMFFMAAFFAILQKNKKIPTLSAGKLECRVITYSKNLLFSRSLYYTHFNRK